jgi:glycosyltransferase involved in cell wall biosynthesis
VEIVAPVGLPPWPLAYHPRYRKRAALPLQEGWKGLTVHRPRFPIVPLFGARRTARNMAAAILPLVRQIRERFPFDVIDAEFFWPDGPVALQLSRALGVPFSITARGSDVQYWMHRRGVDEQLLEASHAAGGMLAVSAALGRVMAGFGMPAERIRTHYTGVDHDRFRPQDRRQLKADLGIKGPLILTAGALIPGKGQRVAIETAERIPEATCCWSAKDPIGARSKP